MNTQNQIAIHLIKEDIKYHDLVYHLSEKEVHIEIYPDIPTAVQALIAPDLTEMETQEWHDQYVQLVRLRKSEVEIYQQLKTTWTAEPMTVEA